MRNTPLHQLASYAERIRKQKQNPLNAAEKAMAAILEELKPPMRIWAVPPSFLAQRSLWQAL